MILSNLSKSSSKVRSGFSLVELSIVLLIIGIVVAGITSGSVLIQSAKISGARQLTISTPVVQKTPNLGLWLETTRRDSFDTIKVDENEIPVWNDLTLVNNGKYVAVDAGGTTTPTYDVDAINGLPGVKMDGLDDYLTIADFKADAYMTLFVVGVFPVMGAGVAASFEQMMIGQFTASGFLFSGYGAGSLPLFYVTRPSGNPIVPQNLGWFGLEPAIGIARYDGVNISYKRHDDESFTDTAAAAVIDSSVSEDLSIGGTAAGFTSNGSFGEIIFYNRALTDAEVDGIMEYLQAKWDIN